jgi:ribosome assembly protein RRB1
MSKRPTSPARSVNGRSENETNGVAKQVRTSAADTSARKDGEGDDGMGEFEDTFEDEYEDEKATGEVIDNASEDEDEDEGEEGMEIDGVKVDGEIQRPESDDEAEPPTNVYIPGVGPSLESGQTLEPDQSAYEMLHRLNVTWPCLSFDVLKDSLGTVNRKYPHSAYFVAGTQADTAKNNELMVMKASSMHKTNKDGGE